MGWISIDALIARPDERGWTPGEPPRSPGREVPLDVAPRHCRGCDRKLDSSRRYYCSEACRKAYERRVKACD